MMCNGEDGAVLTHRYDIESGNFTLAGEAAGSIKKLLKQLGVKASVVRRVAIAAYEAEMNIVIHSVGGVMEFVAKPSEIIIEAKDYGPGIEDINLAMKEGYSTADERARELGFGAGMGLPNIKRCTDEFFLRSRVGQGTILRMLFKNVL